MNKNRTLRNKDRILRRCILRPCNAGLESRIDRAFSDPWIRKKLNRERRLSEHYDYLEKYVPHLFDCFPGHVVDIGPGAGETLEIALALGHYATGIDANSGLGGMGEKYLEACRLIWQRQGLEVQWCGGLRFFETLGGLLPESCVLVNMRGSLEQVFSSHMGGKPHHEHLDCTRMRWLDTDQIYVDVAQMMHAAATLLAKDGAFLIHANGAANGDVMDAILVNAAKEEPFRCEIDEPNLHKFIKTVDAEEIPLGELFASEPSEASPPSPPEIDADA